MKALFMCSICKKDTIHIVVTSQIIDKNYHIRLKCENCDEPPFKWIVEKDSLKGTMIHDSLHKNTS